MRLRELLEDSLQRSRGHIAEGTYQEYDSAVRQFIRVVGDVDYQWRVFLWQGRHQGNHTRSDGIGRTIHLLAEGWLQKTTLVQRHGSTFDLVLLLIRQITQHIANRTIATTLHRSLRT